MEISAETRIEQVNFRIRIRIRSKFAIVVRFLLYPSRYAGTKKE
jgi:hypothetical protein